MYYFVIVSYRTFKGVCSESRTPQLLNEQEALESFHRSCNNNNNNNNNNSCGCNSSKSTKTQVKLRCPLTMKVSYHLQDYTLYTVTVDQSQTTSSQPLMLHPVVFVYDQPTGTVSLYLAVDSARMAVGRSIRRPDSLELATR